MISKISREKCKIITKFFRKYMFDKYIYWKIESFNKKD